MLSCHETSALPYAHSRERMRAAALHSTLDTRSAEFAALVRQQCRALRDDPAEAAATEFAQAAAGFVKGWE